MAVAWIGFAGGIIAAVISALVALRQARMDERLARLNVDFETEKHRRAAMIDRGLAAEDVLSRYREPLAAAAYDLQSRLYNILRLDFFDRYGQGTDRADEALTTTAFRVAQYFGWAEILRRDIQFLSFPEQDTTRKVTHLQAEIASHFLTHRYGEKMMIWGDEQRAIGERMIVEQHGTVLCMGYATFRDCCDSAFTPWSTRIKTEIGHETAQPRIQQVQHVLCDLVRALDPDQLRYTEAIDQA
jgi:hypothetical protein